MNDPVTLTAELWFEAEPRLDREALVAEIPGAELADELVVHPRFVHTSGDGKRATIGTVLAAPEGKPEPGFVPTTAQTWDWPQADQALAAARHSLVVSEIFGRLHPYRDRIAAFLGTLTAAAEQTRPAAIWLPNSQRVLEPSALDELSAFTNVRLFRAPDGSLVMDTLGLHALGLPDVQRHFTGADPTDVAATLFGVAAYELAHGDVIADGDTIGDEPLRAEPTAAYIAPARNVLNLSPA
jgi:hypothetical protein